MTCSTTPCCNALPPQNPTSVGRRVLLNRVTEFVVVAAVLILFVASSPKASASCGDYLYRNGTPVSGHSMPHTLPMDDLQNRSEPEATSQNSPFQLPARRCSGPNCSRSPLPVAPLPAAPSNLIHGFDQMAILEALDRTESSRGCLDIPQSERGSFFEPSSIFRPPAA